MSKLFKSYFVLLLLTTFVRLFDVFKNLLIASKIGVSGPADIFLTMQFLPDYLVVLIGIDTMKGIANSEFSSLYTDNRHDLLKDTFYRLFTVIFVISIVVMLILFFMKDLLIKMTIPGISYNLNHIAITVLTFIIPVFFIKAMNSIVSPYYNATKRFYPPVFMQIVIPVAIIISVFLPYMNGNIVYNISVAFMLGNMLFLIILAVPVVKDFDFSILKRFRLNYESRRILKGCLTLIVLSAINQIYLLSRNYFVSFFPEGSLSALNYGTSVPTFVTTLTFNIVFGVLLSNLSSDFTNKNSLEAKKTFFNTFYLLFVIYVYVVMVFVFNSEIILKIVYMRGNFDINGINLTVYPFLWETMSLLTYLFYIIPTALLLATKNYKYLTFAGIVSFGMGIILNYFLTNYIGFYGVSVTNMIVYFIYGMILFNKVRIVFNGISNEIIRLLKIVAAFLLSAGILYSAKYYLIPDYSQGYVKLDDILKLAVNMLIVLVLMIASLYVFEKKILEIVYSKIPLFKNK